MDKTERTLRNVQKKLLAEQNERIAAEKENAILKKELEKVKEELEKAKNLPASDVTPSHEKSSPTSHDESTERTAGSNDCTAMTNNAVSVERREDGGASSSTIAPPPQTQKQKAAAFLAAARAKARDASLGDVTSNEMDEKMKNESAENPATSASLGTCRDLGGSGDGGDVSKISHHNVVRDEGGNKRVFIQHLQRDGAGIVDGPRVGGEPCLEEEKGEILETAATTSRNNPVPIHTPPPFRGGGGNYYSAPSDSVRSEGRGEGIHRVSSYSDGRQRGSALRRGDNGDYRASIHAPQGGGGGGGIRASSYSDAARGGGGGSGDNRASFSNAHRVGDNLRAPFGVPHPRASGMHAPHVGHNRASFGGGRVGNYRYGGRGMRENRGGRAEHTPHNSNYRLMRGTVTAIVNSQSPYGWIRNDSGQSFKIQADALQHVLRQRIGIGARVSFEGRVDGKGKAAYVTLINE